MSTEKKAAPVKPAAGSMTTEAPAIVRTLQSRESIAATATVYARAIMDGVPEHAAVSADLDAIKTRITTLALDLGKRDGAAMLATYNDGLRLQAEYIQAAASGPARAALDAVNRYRAIDAAYVAIKAARKAAADEQTAKTKEYAKLVGAQRVTTSALVAAAGLTPDDVMPLPPVTPAE